MSRNVVETNVVAMEFDARNFQSGVQSALRDLTQLRNAMNLDSAARSLSNIDKAVNSVDLSNMGRAVDGISNRFSTMSIVATAAIATITAKITGSLMNAAHQMKKTLFLDPIMQGYQEYEMQIGSIQTILANTRSHGTTLDEVMHALNMLNDFSDKTIYNFAQMVQSIGAFTTAGVDLGTSVDAIQGISGLAAMSGADAEKTARAMYMFSQAIADGSLRLMQWNSLQTAGMAGETFRNELIRTAEVHGVNVQELIDKYGSFRLTLQEGWATNEIVMETLAKFSGEVTEDQLRAIGYTEEAIEEILELGEVAMAAATNVKTLSMFKTVLRESIATGWTTTAVAVVGDFEESVEFYRGLNEMFAGVIAETADFRNDQLMFWKKAGGRDDMIAAMTNVIQGVLDLMALFRSAWHDIFPRIRAGNLLAMTSKLLALSERFKMGEDSAKTFQDVVRGVASAIDIVRMLVSAVLKPIKDFVLELSKGSGEAFEMAGNFARMITELRDWIKETSFFNVKVGEFLTYISDIIERLKGFGRDIMSLLIVQDIVACFEKFLGLPLPSFSVAVGGGFLGISKALEGFVGWCKELKILAPLFEWLSELSWEGFLEWADKSYGEHLPAASARIRDFREAWSMFVESIRTGWKEFALFDSTADAINNFTDKIKETKEEFMALESVEVLSGWLKTFDGSRIKAFREAVGEEASFFRGIMKTSGGFLKDLFNKHEKPDLTEVFQTIDKVLMKIAGYIKEAGISLDWPRFFDFIKVAISLWVGKASVSAAREVATSFKHIGDMFKKGPLATLVTGKREESKVGQQLIQTLKSVEGVLMGFQTNLKADALLKIAGAIAILTGSLFMLSMLDNAKLMVGVAGLAALAGQLVGAVYVLAMVPTVSLMKASTALIVMAGALGLVSLSVLIFSRVDAEDLAKGIIAVAASLGVLMLAGASLGKGAANLTMVGGSLASLAMGLIVLSLAVRAFGSMDHEVLEQGFLYILGAMGGFALFSRAVRPSGIIRAAVAMAILAGALILLSYPVSIFGNMDWDVLEKGLVSLAIGLGILVVGLNLMRGAIPGAIALAIASGALTLLAIAVKVLSTVPLEGLLIALGAVAGAFVILGVAGLVMGPIVPILVALGASVLLLGVGMLAAGAGVSLFAAGLLLVAGSAPLIAGSIMIIGAAVFAVIPKFAEAAAKGVAAFVETLAENAPRIITAIVNLLVGFVLAVDKALPEIVGAIFSIILTLLEIFTKAIPNFVESGVKLLLAFLEGIASKSQMVTSVVLRIIIGFLLGVARNIRMIVYAGVYLLTEFIKGIADSIPLIVDASFEVVLAFIEGVADAIEEYTPQIIEASNKLGDAILDGLAATLVNGVGRIGTAAQRLGTAIISNLAQSVESRSPSKASERISNWVVDGLLKPLDVRKDEVRRGYSSLMNSAKQGLQQAAMAIESTMNDDLFTPTLRPVLDLSLVESGLGGVNGLLSSADLSALVSLDDSSDLGGVRPGGEVKHEFNQYITSPKPLTTAEVYRHSKSLLARAARKGEED